MARHLSGREHAGLQHGVLAGPSLAGKLAGLDAARVFVVLWGTWGLFLTWLWLCVFSGRRSLLLALLMAAFGSLLNFQCWLGLDLFRLHYFGTAEQIMCSANASIPVLLFSSSFSNETAILHEGYHILPGNLI